MMIKDVIWGENEIDEPVLVELMETPQLQRLRDISQYGVPEKYFYNQDHSFDRFEHSVGVMLVIRKLGFAEQNNLEEQVAGLLHDVSHLAFSHVTEPIFDADNPEESYHETLRDRFVRGTEVEEVLLKYGVDVERVIDESNWSLLEQDTPDLCADRVDYALRELYYLGCRDEVKLIVDDLRSYQGKMVMGSVEYGRLFAELFLNIQIHRWGSWEGNKRYQLWLQAVKRGLELDLFGEHELLGGEAGIVAVLEASEDPTIVKNMSDLVAAEFPYAECPGVGEHTYKKFRYIDPKVMQGNMTKRVSELDLEFARILEQARDENEKGLWL